MSKIVATNLWREMADKFWKMNMRNSEDIILTNKEDMTNCLLFIERPQLKIVHEKCSTMRPSLGIPQGMKKS